MAATSAPAPTVGRGGAPFWQASAAPRWWTGASGQDEQQEQWHRGPLLLGLAVCSALVLAALAGVTWASLDRPSAGMVLAGPAPATTTPDLTAPAPPEATEPALTLTEATEPAPTPPGATEPAANLAAATALEPEWSSILARLDAARAKAYLNGDAALLQSVYAPQAPAGDRDAQSLATLIKGDRRIEGLNLSTTAISPLEVTADQAVLRVVDTLAPPVMVELGSGARQTMQGRGERVWTVIVRRADSAWQIWEVQEGGTWPAAEP